MQSVTGFDVYNMAVTGFVSKTLNSIRSDSDHTPVVFIEEKQKEKENEPCLKK